MSNPTSIPETVS